MAKSDSERSCAEVEEQFGASDPTVTERRCSAGRPLEEFTWRFFEASGGAGEEDLIIQIMLTHYALERLLYRLRVSAHRERFILRTCVDSWFHLRRHSATGHAGLLAVRGQIARKPIAQ